MHNFFDKSSIKINLSKPHVTKFIPLLLVTTLFSTAELAAQTQAPHGSERLALHVEGNDSLKYFASGYFENESSEFVYNNFANVFSLGGPSSYANVTDRRLIDIEVNVTGAEYDMELSGVWVENDGWFKQESYLSLGLTEQDLMDWQLLEEFIPLDIERYVIGKGDYKNSKEERFAVIWQRNRHKVDWEFMLGVGTDDILRKQNIEGLRVVDFDQFRSYPSMPGVEMFFDAILVENDGQNYLDAEFRIIHSDPLSVKHITSTITGYDNDDTDISWWPWYEDLYYIEYLINIAYHQLSLFENEFAVDVEFLEFPSEHTGLYFKEQSFEGQTNGKSC